MICISNWLFWSVKKECYTIGNFGLKHQERQNSESWAYKLHWCGIIWSFACGGFLPVLYASSLIIYLILNWPSIALYFARHYVILYDSFVLMLLPSGLCSVGCTYLALLWLFSCLCSLAVFWIPKCLAFRLEGEWLLSSWSWFPTAHIWVAAQLSGSCCWDVTGMWFLWHKNTHTLMCSSWWKSVWKTDEANCCHIKSQGEIIIFNLHYPSMTMQPFVIRIVNKEPRALGRGKGQCSSSHCVSLWSHTDVAKRADTKAWGALSVWRHRHPDIMLRSLDGLWVTAQVMPL